MAHKRVMLRDSGQKEILQDRGGYREGFFRRVLGLSSKTLENKIQGTELRWSGNFLEV